MRRPIRINAELPELTPTQVKSLWNFLDNLATELWDAYEPELLNLENEHSGRDEFDSERNTDEYHNIQLEKDACPLHPWNNSETCPACDEQPNSAARKLHNDTFETDF
jgi:hypothetical protein